MIAFLAILHSRAQRGRLWLIQDFRNAMTGCALRKKYDEELRIIILAYQLPGH